MGATFPSENIQLGKMETHIKPYTDAGAEVALLSNFLDQRNPLICSVSQSGPTTES